MALQSEGEISVANLNDQVRQAQSRNISLNDGQLRGLAGKTSGAIAMSDFYGKWAGARLTSAYDSVSKYYGFQQGIAGSIEGYFAGSNLKSCYWAIITGLYILGMETVSGAPQPTSRTVKITDDNFNVLATYTLSAWTLSNGVWSAGVNAPTNPFPAGSIRWLTW